jgi:hypothetical protein
MTPEEKRRRLEARLFGLGATGEYPHGRLNEEDEGELRCSIHTEGGKVVLNFGKEVAWIAITPGQARQLAAHLLGMADKLEGRAHGAEPDP